MGFMLVLAGLVVIACCFLLKIDAVAYLLVAVLVLGLALVGTGLLPHYLLKYLQADYEQRPVVAWQANNAIVLLGAGLASIDTEQPLEPGHFAFSRLGQTVELYNKCRESGKTCTVIISGGDPLGYGASEADIYRETLVALGVERDHIIPEPSSHNTWQNAELTVPLLQTGGFDQVVLVTQGIHMRRSLFSFARLGVTDLVPVRSDYTHARISPVPIWYNFALLDMALHEYVGYLFYRLKDWFSGR